MEAQDWLGLVLIALAGIITGLWLGLGAGAFGVGFGCAALGYVVCRDIASRR